MQKFESIFHQLQKEGQKALEISWLKPGFKHDPTLFLENNLAQRFNDPLPVFVIPESTAQIFTERLTQTYVSMGLPLNEDLSEQDRVAHQQLLTEERLKSHLPGRRFAIEFHRNNGTVDGLLVEAIKVDKTDATNKEIPYQGSECENKTISESNYFHLYAFHKDASLFGERQHITLNGWSYMFTPSNMLEGSLLKLVMTPLGGDRFELSEVPANRSINEAFDWRSIYELPPPRENKTYGKFLSDFLALTLDFLWVLDREPQLLEQRTESFSESNKSRRMRRLPSFSPIHTITINAEALRRVEFRRAAEIADAITNKGGYKIPGLVLVGKHPRPSTGTVVEAYARCADQVVRDMATELLREENYTDLAELVRDFGNRTTQTRLTLSDAYIARIV